MAQLSAADDFESWYRQTRPGIVAAIVALTGDRATSLDAVDEAFARALVRWHRVARLRSPAGWVYTVAANEARRLLKRRGRDEQLRSKLRAETTPSTAGGEYLWDAVASLPRRQSTAIVLRYVAGFTHEETALTMGISRPAVTKHLKRAHETLRHSFGGDAHAAVHTTH